MSSTTTRFLGAAALVLLGSSACGSTSSDSDATGGAASSGGAGGGGGTGGASEPALCDGSASIRFSATLGGGMVMPSYVFTNPYGWSFFYVTGGCEYFLGGSVQDGVKSGKLDPARAQELATAVHRSNIPSYSSWLDMGCPDAGNVAISDGTSSAYCSCGCDPDAPKGLESAIDAASQWKEKLWNEGSPLDGPVAAAAQTKEVTAQPAKAWPLSWPITDLPLPNEPGGKVVTDAGDAAKLRGLREGSTFEGVLIDVGGLRYELFVRDEFPDAVKTAIAASK